MCKNVHDIIHYDTNRSHSSDIYIWHVIYYKKSILAIYLFISASYNLHFFLLLSHNVCLQVCNSSYEVFILLVNGVLWCSTVHGFLPAATESYYIQAKMLQKKTLAYDPKNSKLSSRDWHAGRLAGTSSQQAPVNN